MDFAAFFDDEDGSYYIEAVIWMPMFAIQLAVTMNVSLVFFNQCQILRVVQDAIRMFSLGRFDTEHEVEKYVSNELAYMESQLKATTTVQDGLVTSQTQVPSGDLMPMNFMRRPSKGTQITVYLQNIIDFQGYAPCPFQSQGFLRLPKVKTAAQHFSLYSLSGSF